MSKVAVFALFKTIKVTCRRLSSVLCVICSIFNLLVDSLFVSCIFLSASSKAPQSTASSSLRSSYFKDCKYRIKHELPCNIKKKERVRSKRSAAEHEFVLFNRAR